tara:strand:+ start:46065 stop:46652 length:588 start_codon:yes stop_codon:yes gene_type:complete
MPEEKLIAEQTHIRCKIIIEVLGKPKEHVEKTLKEYVDKINNDSDLIVLNSEFSKPAEKDRLWATFVEMDVIIKGIPKLVGFCFDYMPSSVEIIKPEEFITKKSTVEDLINDLQARLHEVDMIVKQQKNENEFLKQNLNKAATNTILISLTTGNLDKEKLSKATGVPEKELDIFLNALIKENKIKKENEIYSLVR